MDTKLKFSQFNRHKDIDECLFEVSHWTTAVEFIPLELNFIKSLLKLYPFKKNSFNLFERIQLYIQKIDTLHKENTTILENLRAYKLALNMNEAKTDSVRHEDLAELIFNYEQEYITFKSEVYEYIHAIIK